MRQLFEHRQIEQVHPSSIRFGELVRPLCQKRVKALAASMSEIGLRTPITIRMVDDYLDHDGVYVDGQPIVVAGAHRLEAARLLGWNYIECFLFEDDSEADSEAWQLHENLHRNELTPSKRAEIQRRAEKVKQLRDQGMTQQQIADAVGVHRNTVSSDLNQCTEKSVQTEKPVQPRKVTQYTVTQYTKPETAAEKIRAKFGDDFALQLAASIQTEITP